jgi:hypothetical protein
LRVEGPHVEVHREAPVVTSDCSEKLPERVLRGIETGRNLRRVQGTDTGGTIITGIEPAARPDNRLRVNTRAEVHATVAEQALEEVHSHTSKECQENEQNH